MRILFFLNKKRIYGTLTVP